jgi:diguanylate cyclase (GGDEF)-like protein
VTLQMNTGSRGAEHRRYPRYQVDLDARVKNLVSDESADGQVRDLCLGGALLCNLTVDWLRAISVGVGIELSISLPTATTLPLLVKGRVARLEDGATGICFEQPSKAVLDSLKQIIAASTKNPHPSHEQPQSVGAGMKRASSILDGMMASRCVDILETWLQAAEESLWQHAKFADNDRQRRQYGDEAVGFSQLLRSEKSKGLIECLQQRDAIPEPRMSAATVSGGDDLALVDTDDFETWLEYSLLVSHLEDDLGTLLPVINSQLSSAFGDTDRLTLKPDRLAASFDCWADTHDLSSAVRRIAMQTGRRVLPRLLGCYYRDLSRGLEEVGFAPAEIKREWRKPSQAAVMPGEVRGETSAPASPAASAQAGQAGGTVHDVPGAHGEGELTASQAAELLMALSPDALRQASDGESGRSLKERSLALLASQMPAVSSQPLEARLHQRIEATDRVLNHIVGSAGSSPQMREWVERLSGRMLAAAVADEHFFKSPGHPLLQVLGQLDRLAMFLPDEPEDEGGIRQEIETLVQQALAIDVRNMASYEPVMAQLYGLGKRLGEHFQQDAQRAIQRLEGQERRHRAHLHVQAQLARRLGGQRLHKAVAELIDTAWSTLLELHYLREGEEGALQQQAWSVLMQLHALCGGEGDSEGQDIRDLDNELMAGLSYVGFDPFQAKGMMQQIRDAVRRHRSGLSSQDDYLTFSPRSDVAEQQAPPKGIDPKVLDDLMAQIDGLQLGTGLRHRKGGGDQPMRLVWRSADDMLFAFLDGSSGEVNPYSRGELLKGLYSGLMQLQSTSPTGIADLALDATLHEMQERIRYHESRDALTGLFTRQQFTGRLAELLQAGRARGSHVVGYLDIDHFEAVTGTCGYQAGEQLLQALAGLLLQLLGEQDFLAFMGGRRFAFVLHEQDIKKAAPYCEQLLREVYALPFEWEGYSYPVTGSLGIAPLQPGQADPDALLSAVEIASSAAQQAGGNRLVVFREDDDTIGRQRERLRWLGTAEDVIKSRRLRLRAQTIAPLNPEAGLRGHHEVLMTPYDGDGEMLDLERFISTAEAFKLMGKVDRLVIGKALQWATAHRKRFAELGGLAINLSGLSLSDPGLLGYIREQLSQSGIAPQQISFEVTETAAIASLERAVTIIEGIKDIGCAVALDDFGTGMSSYSYLKSMPVDYVKIDGSFIRDLLTNPHDLAIVRSITEIAHFMGIRTIAEYVENEQISDKLREIGVDYVQGYAIQRPVFLDELVSG